MVFKTSPFKPQRRHTDGFKKFGIVVLAVAIIGLGFFSAKPIMNLLGNIKISTPSKSSVSEKSNSSATTSGNKSNNTINNKEIRAAYIPAAELTPEGINSFIEFAKANNVNGAVIDLKNSEGIIVYSSTVQRAIDCQAISKTPVDLKNFVTKLKNSGIYTIAKLMCFKDTAGSNNNYKLAASLYGGAGRWNYNFQRWLNAYKQENWDYLSAIGSEACDMGFDEVMLDEVKFPDKGSTNKIDYGEDASKPRSEAINGFIKYITDKLHEKKVKVSLCTLPLSVYDKGSDESGQIFDFSTLNVDLLSPRFDPTSFRISRNFAVTVGGKAFSAPEQTAADIISTAMNETFQKIKSVNSKIGIRPFIQCYDAYGVTFGANEINAQSKAVTDAGGSGYIYFNENGVYNLK